ncbi:MAG: hypothetical protein AAB316_12255, partial [Bacteroidota bacterium]
QTVYASEQKELDGKTWTFHKNTLSWDGSPDGSITWEGTDGGVGRQWQDVDTNSPEWKNCWSKSIEPAAKPYNGNWKTAKIEMLESSGTDAPALVIDLSKANPADVPGAAPLTKEQSMQAFVEKMNALRTDPAGGGAVIDALLKRRGKDYPASAEFTQDQVRGKTRQQHVAGFKAWLNNQPKLGTLTWDDDLAKIAASGGKATNRFTKLDFNLAAWGDPLDNALFGWAADGENGIERLRDSRLKFIGIASKPGGSKEEFVIVASETKGSIFLASNADFANRPFQIDVTWLPVSEKSNLPYERCPQIVGYPNADGSLDIAWLTADGSKIFVHRAGADLQAGQANSLEQRRSFNSLGLFAGYTRIGEDDFVLSAEKHAMPDQPQALKLFK